MAQPVCLSLPRDLGVGLPVPVNPRYTPSCHPRVPAGPQRGREQDGGVRGGKRRAGDGRQSRGGQARGGVIPAETLAALPRSLLMLGLNQYFDVSITNFMVGCPALRGPARDLMASRPAWDPKDLHGRHPRAGQSSSKDTSLSGWPRLKVFFNPFDQSFLPAPQNDSFST